MKNFTQVPNEVISTKKLSPTAKMLFISILSKNGTKKDGTKFNLWLSLEKIGEIIDIKDRRYIRKYTDELLNIGLLTTKSKPTNTGRPIQEYIVNHNFDFESLMDQEEVKENDFNDSNQNNKDELIKVKSLKQQLLEKTKLYNN